jgi:LysM repeat protein
MQMWHFCFVQLKAKNINTLNKGLGPCLFFGLLAILSSVYGQSSVTIEYIKTYSSIAMDEMRQNQVPASITLAQGILESSNGKSKLSTDCNNHFGIKCKKNWTGTYCTIDDDAPDECFRGYPTPAESYKDHSLFLKNNTRYADLFRLAITDYKAWAYGLKQAGYATNPAYPTLLISLIERFRLSQYDSLVIFGDNFVLEPDATATTRTTELTEVNGIPAIRARAGDTPKSIADRNDMGRWQVYRYNDLCKTDQIDPGEVVYLKPKRRKAEIASHIYKEGEDLRDISQSYGIKLKQIYKKNRIKPGVTVADGELIFMQEKRGKDNPIKTLSNDRPVKEQPIFVKQNNNGIHYVKQGETLYSIAKGYNVSTADILKWSGISSANLSLGQKLIVAEPMVKPVLTPETPKYDLGNDPIVSPDTVKQNLVQLTSYMVKEGETLYSISKQMGVSVAQIMELNNMTAPQISVGQLLTIKMEKVSTSVINETPVDESRYHTVKAGETLYSISRITGVPVPRLKELNNLPDAAIKLGQRLLIR